MASVRHTSHETEETTRKGRRLRVLIADGETLFREALRFLLEQQPNLEVVGEAGRAAEIVAEVAKACPEVVVSSISLPDAPEPTFLPDLLQACPKVRVVMLAGAGDTQVIPRVLAAGAHGLVLRDAPSELVVHAIRAVAAGETWVQREVIHYLSRELQLLSNVAPAGATGRLTPREQEILELLAAGHSTQEIARRLYIASSTVRVHLGRILGKLGLRNRIEAVRYAIREHLVWL